MVFVNTILYVVGILCAIWVIYDVLADNKKLSDGIKVLWIILAILFSIITAIIYYFVYKK
jgi:prolipoprotein diacylglyceryltransferase